MAGRRQGAARPAALVELTRLAFCRNEKGRPKAAFSIPVRTREPEAQRTLPLIGSSMKGFCLSVV